MNNPFTSFSAFSTGRLRNNERQSQLCSPMHLCTIDILSLYSKCNPSFIIAPKIPQRILTQPFEPSAVAPHDNKDGNLICRVNDIIECGHLSYTILDLLGTGTFGQVFKCKDNTTDEVIAMKVVKGKPAYKKQGLLEAKIAEMLNRVGNETQNEHIVQLRSSFEYKGHVCILFELLDISLLEFLQQHQYRGLPINVVRTLTSQLLISLHLLQETNVIHCDLKPENILLSQTQKTSLSSVVPKKVRTQDSSHQVTREGNGIITSTSTTMQTSSNSLNLISIKLIDFGSACYEDQKAFTYIQSRYYRAPEVLLGLPYTGAIDMWSLGCVCMEMFLGLPIFPGMSQHNQLCRITKTIGDIPDMLIQSGKNSKLFYVPEQVTCGIGKYGTGGMTGSMNHNTSQRASSGMQTVNRKYRLKTPEEYAADNNIKVLESKRYLKSDQLSDIILKAPIPGQSRLTQQQKMEEMRLRRLFLDFVGGLLKVVPWERFTAKQALLHPFITGDTGGDTTSTATTVSGGSVSLPSAFQPPPDSTTLSRVITCYPQFVEVYRQQGPHRHSSASDACHPHQAQVVSPSKIAVDYLKPPKSTPSKSRSNAPNSLNSHYISGAPEHTQSTQNPSEHFFTKLTKHDRRESEPISLDHQRQYERIRTFGIQSNQNSYLMNLQQAQYNPEKSSEYKEMSQPSSGMSNNGHEGTINRNVFTSGFDGPMELFFGKGFGKPRSGSNGDKDEMLQQSERLHLQHQPSSSSHNSLSQHPFGRHSITSSHVGVPIAEELGHDHISCSSANASNIGSSLSSSLCRLSNESWGGSGLVEGSNHDSSTNNIFPRTETGEGREVGSFGGSAGSDHFRHTIDFTQALHRPEFDDGKFLKSTSQDTFAQRRHSYDNYSSDIYHHNVNHVPATGFHESVILGKGNTNHVRLERDGGMNYYTSHATSDDIYKKIRSFSGDCITQLNADLYGRRMQSSAIPIPSHQIPSHQIPSHMHAGNIHEQFIHKGHNHHHHHHHGTGTGHAHPHGLGYGYGHAPQQYQKQHVYRHHSDQTSHHFVGDSFAAPQHYLHTPHQHLLHDQHQHQQHSHHHSYKIPTIQQVSGADQWPRLPDDSAKHSFHIDAFDVNGESHASQGLPPLPMDVDYDTGESTFDANPFFDADDI